jgi:hypothetical protein
LRFVVALLCAIALWHGGSARAADDASRIPKEWLDKKISVEEAEAAHPEPFGFQSQAWEALKAAMQPGDELWTFASPAKSWEDLAGRAGIAVVRDGNPIKVLVTVMN